MTRTLSDTAILTLLFITLTALAEWLRYPDNNALSHIAASVAQLIGGL